MSTGLLYMAPYDMCSLGAAVTGTVDDTYDPNDLCDGDPSFEVSGAGGLSLTAAGASVVGVDGLVVVNHNLLAGTNAVFGGGVGAHTLIAPAVPKNGICLNFYTRFIPAVTASGFTFNVTQGIRSVVGEVFAGRFREMRGLPPESSLSLVPIEVPAGGEYGGLSVDRGAAPMRKYGGTVYLTDAGMALVQDWYDSCRSNSLPSVIVPFPQRDPWVVKWTTFQPSPVAVDVNEVAAWKLTCEWEELPRFRYPVEP